MALRYFAGGSAYDIALVHGVAYTEVYKSVWKVVDAVNKCKELEIQFPDNWDEQRQLAAQFQKKSKAGFGSCVGAVDGILIWIERPTDENCIEAKCGPKKFFCGRKKRFGINMQATCDANGRFLDIFLKHPGATSDYLAFSTSPLQHKLEQNGFLAPGFCLFGDNAYVNTNYMATPYKGQSHGTKDDYNFYHSQLRINIECAFDASLQS
jgi:hypothetical protein